MAERNRDTVYLIVQWMHYPSVLNVPREDHTVGWVDTEEEAQQAVQHLEETHPMSRSNRGYDDDVDATYVTHDYTPLVRYRHVR